MKYLIFLTLVFYQLAYASEKGCELIQEMRTYPYSSIDIEFYPNLFKNENCTGEFSPEDFISSAKAKRLIDKVQVIETEIEKIMSHSDQYHPEYLEIIKVFNQELKNERNHLMASFQTILEELTIKYKFTNQYATLRNREDLDEKIVLDCLRIESNVCTNGNLVKVQKAKKYLLARIEFSKEYKQELKREMRKDDWRNYRENSVAHKVFIFGSELIMYSHGILLPVGLPIMLSTIPIYIGETLAFPFLPKTARVLKSLFNGKNSITSFEIFKNIEKI